MTSRLRLNSRGGKTAFLTLVDSSAAARRIGDAFLRLFPPVFALILAVSAVGAWLCSRMIARPIVRLAETSKRLSGLDMTWRCDEGRADEIGVLGRSLNDMAARLSETMQGLENANERLRREAQTATRRERQRRDFFAAASHELKTPLAVIQSQTEGMLMGIGDYADHAAHLPRVLAASQRMDALVGEMLDMARMDEPPSAERTRIDVREAVRHSVERARGRAESRGVELRFEAGAPCFALVDDRLLALALDNVAVNVAAHADEGSVAHLRLDGGVLRVENACSRRFSPEEMERLCEPFYRPDPSRASESGGTGLGLAIAKEAFGLLGIPFTLGCESGTFIVEAVFPAGPVCPGQTEN